LELKAWEFSDWVKRYCSLVRILVLSFRYSEEIMKPSTEDKAEGKIHEVKGKIKEEVGKATNDPSLEVSGKAEKNAGKVQNLIGHVEKAVGE
jgi:uncharacterized protein YjbJ (UPF0337 family)